MTTSTRGEVRSVSLLADILRDLAVPFRAELDRLKANHNELQRPDFLWRYLLSSFATMGKSSGWSGLIGNTQNYSRVDYAALLAIGDDRRLAHVEAVCRAAKVRMPARKATFITGCFDKVRALGGPEASKAVLLAQVGRAGKLRWLRTLPGIGEKYARNILMDVYHEEFRDSVAIDIRIKAISSALGLTFASYEVHEAFYLGVAAQAGLNGWELDRLLYHHRAEVERRILERT